ncbi:hypothetical protein GCM10010211_59220 [Streptomyces albospinus]|uniref:Uncharacterized protein n=1 Tax=Streptomyces albospinus TaxID=285515 RepID=A0ABQ2VGM5_9ACTN|nr:hypothetical protein [Streptomyces albospinus]GGU85294.1 hypothetical protein GCM10010211_59220 [Streptomyces albospinus]
MSRRVSLPGADELFRTTGGVGLQPSAPRRSANGAPAGEAPRVPAPAGESDSAADVPEAGAARQRRPENGADPEGAPAADGGSAARTAPAGAPAEHSGREPEPESPKGHRTAAGRAGRGEAESAQGAGPGRRRGGRGANRRPSGRERHDEKITVYVSAEELMDLEHARLVLRGEHGLAVDRGRIVREAVAVVLADLESRGDASILVRRLRGR